MTNEPASHPKNLLTLVYGDDAIQLQASDIHRHQPTNLADALASHSEVHDLMDEEGSCCKESELKSLSSKNAQDACGIWMHVESGQQTGHSAPHPPIYTNRVFRVNQTLLSINKR